VIKQERYNIKAPEALAYDIASQVPAELVKPSYPKIG